MGSQQERTEQIEALRGLIDRLCAPDLTLAEAKVLRGRISDLLEREDRRGGWDQMASSPTIAPSSSRGDGPPQEIWSPETSMRVAG